MKCETQQFRKLAKTECEGNPKIVGNPSTEVKRISILAIFHTNGAVAPKAKDPATRTPVDLSTTRTPSSHSPREELLGMIGLSWLPSSNGRKASLMTYCNHLTLSLVRQPGNNAAVVYILAGSWNIEVGGLADRKPKRVELSGVWQTNKKQFRRKLTEILQCCFIIRTLQKMLIH